VKYRVTCLTPLLVGDGGKLSPIDYMVWKDQVNVLDQQRIFRLLAKGTRLDSYLAQLKRADKLDFASWGGFAQNYADRRIPFEHASCAGHWEKARGDSTQIPTFASGPRGPYLPASALKGALRTGVLFAGLEGGSLDAVAGQYKGERPPKRPAEVIEDTIVGSPGTCRMRLIKASDSASISYSNLRIYLLRVATLLERGRGSLELGWKQSPRGSVDGRRPEDSAAVFAEMATPGTRFEGEWQERDFLQQPEIRRVLRWKDTVSVEAIFRAANDYAEALLASHAQYAQQAGLSLLGQNLQQLAERLREAREREHACLLSMGWGAGLLAKVAWLRTDDPVYREIIRQTPLYGRSIAPSLPFPKTRRIVFLQDRPATLAGWVLLEGFPC
jgi:CRISPR-associated protein Csm5